MSLGKVKILTCSQSLTDYLNTLLSQIYNQDLYDYMNTLVIMPSRRSVKCMKRTMLEGYGARVLPKIVAVNDLETQFCDAGVPLSAYEQKGIILKIVKELNKKEDVNLNNALGAIEKLIDDFNTYEINLDKLDNIVPENLSDHWHVTLNFINKFLVLWKEKVHDQGLIEPSLYNIKKIRSFSTVSANNNIILAGLDGYIPAISGLISKIKSYDKGYVILNGFIPGDSAPGCSHPNYLLSQLADSKIFEKISALTSKEHIITNIMSNQSFQDRPMGQYDLSYINLIESSTLSDEVVSVSLVVRKSLEDKNKKIAVVTSDDNFSRMLKQQLMRWNIVVDCAGGIPFIDTLSGRLLKCLLNIELPSASEISFLSIVKHPLVKLYNASHTQLLRIINSIEVKWRKTHSKQDNDFTATEMNLLQSYTDIVTPFINLKREGTHSLTTWLHAHIKVCEELSAPAPGKESELWNSAHNGKELAAVIKQLFNSSEHFPLLTYTEYKNIIIDVLSQSTIRDAVSHKRLRLLSPLQALYEDFDIVILSGLNEGIWPAYDQSNRLMNRTMGMELGLPDPQILVGRSAFFFAQALHSDKVYISYANTRDGSPAKPSRWVLKLKAFAQFIGAVEQISPDINLLYLKNKLNYVEKIAQYNLPKPSPDLSLRPVRLSVSAIETLLNDPYQIYAKYILHLNNLEDLSATVSSASFGTWVHAVLEHATIEKNYSADNLTKIADKFMPDITDEYQVLWRTNFNSFVHWIAQELTKRSHNATVWSVESTMQGKFYCGARQFDIIGKADRIDVLADGSYEIIDYKTGVIPSKNDVESLQAPQLPLLALLLIKNNNCAVSKLTYIALKDKKVVSFDAGTLITNMQDKLEELLSYYLKVESCYPINPLYALGNPYNSFAHLERIEEWVNNTL